jgi:predicted RNase H-like nuclease (RuvC/YqgF family)
VKDTKLLLLGMLSVGLVGTWIYHLYDKTQYTRRRTEVFIKDSIAVAQGVQDSLQKIYSKTINTLDAELDSTKSTAGILQGALSTKLAEINRLKNEIASILKRNNFKKEDLDLARKKTLELQQLVAALQNKNTSIEEEKKQITEVLDKVTVQVKSLEGNVQKLDQENKVLTEKINLASSFVASELKLSPVTVKNDKELETNQAKKASKLVISFVVQNNVTDYGNADVFIVITQPDGRILQNDDVWETSTINLQAGGRINYTRKIRFEYHKGESKRLLFSLNAEEYLKGTYTLQLFHNGYMIGQTMKTLN